MVEILSLLVLIGLTIFIGYIGSLIFDKTKIPDALWLILFGFVISALNVLDTTFFLSISGLMASIALFIILFDAGLNINFYQMIRQLSRSLSLSIISIVLSMVTIITVSMFYFNMDFLSSLLLGAMLSGTSSAIVVPLVEKLKTGSKVRTILDFESIFTDPLVIVISLAIISFMVSGSAGNPVNQVLSIFSIGAMFGLVAGVIWLFVLEELKGRPFDYMLTLGALVFLYAMTEYVQGSGAIAALMFGIVLGNAATFSTILKTDKKFQVNHLLKNFQGEISFFVRSFFFVFIGMVVSINYDTFFIGNVIALSIILVRFIAVRISTVGMKIASYERNIMQIMVPRGLAPIILTQLPILYAIPNYEFFTKIVLTVMLVTVVYTTLMILFYSRNDTVTKPNNKELKLAEKQFKREKKRKK
jgi:potassium/hydrogen antiporter